LIFDAFAVKDEYRSEFNKSIKEHASFFKHANKDWDKSVELAPILSILFLMGAAAGIRLMGEPQSIEETRSYFGCIFTSRTGLLIPFVNDLRAAFQ
jgi:hypothetical protein